MGVPVFGASGALGAAASGTSITPALPAGITAGQLLLGIVASKNNGTHTWPAGWTKQAQVNSGASWTVSWATRIAQGGDTAPAVTWSGSVANTGIISRWTGTDFVAIGAIGAVGTGTVSPHTSTALTTTRDNSLVIFLDGVSINTALTVPAGYTSRITSGSATSVTHLDVGSQTFTTHGTSTGAISTAGGAAAWVQWQIELLGPASQPPSPSTANQQVGAEQIFDLPPLGTAPVGNIDLRTWLQSLAIRLPNTTDVFRQPVFSTPSTLVPYYDISLRTAINTLPPGGLVAIKYTFNAPLYTNPRGYEYSVGLRTWLGTPPQPLPLQPPGEIVIDLPPHAAAPIQQDTPQQNILLQLFTPAISYTFNGPVYAYFLPPPPPITWFTSPNLVLLTPAVAATYQIGGKLFANPIGPDYPISLRSWFGVIPPTPIAIPFKQTDWPINRGYEFDWRRSWDWKYNLNLIGKDQLPVGENVTDLPPQPYRQPAITFIGLFPPPTPVVGKPFAQYDWPLAPQPFRPDFGFFNFLIGPVTAPLNQQTGADWQLPQQPAYHVQLRTWLQSPQVPPVAAKPFTQTDWPNPTLLTQPTRGWAQFFNLDLIGQDKLPFRQTDWPNPTQPYRAPELSTWIERVKLLLAVPFKQTDWPNPRTPQQPALGFTASYNLNLIGKDQLPVGEIVTDLAPQPARRQVDVSNWINTVNLAVTTVVAKLPFNQSDWPNPTAPFIQNDLRSWISQTGILLAPPPAPPQFQVGGKIFANPTAPHYPISLRSFFGAIPPPVAVRPFSQTDWPNPRGPIQPDRSFGFVFARELIGKDRMTAGRQQDWPLPNRGPQQPAQSFTASYNQNLIGKDRMTAGRQQDWPNPNLGPMQPDRSFVFWPGAPYFPPPAPPPPTSIGIGNLIGAYPKWRRL